MMKETIKDYYGRILGYIEEDGQRLVAKDYYGKILGYYYKNENKTKDFYGKILYYGNALSALIVNNS